MSINWDQYYAIYGWPDDYASPEGQQHLLKARETMSILMQHKWLQAIVDNNNVVHLHELCSGGGVGGVSLGEKFKQHDKQIKVTFSDVRANVLQQAAFLYESMFGVCPITIVSDALCLDGYREYDIALLYGLSTPHFNPWRMIQLIHRVAAMLRDEGLFIIEEIDRRQTDLIDNPYQKMALTPGRNGQLLTSLHAGYNRYTGECKRDVVGLNVHIEPLRTEAYFWGIAELGALMWTVFSEVDFVEIGQGRVIIVGRSPRRTVSDLSREVCRFSGH